MQMNYYLFYHNNLGQFQIFEKRDFSSGHVF